jgi:hypothetical protein
MEGAEVEGDDWDCGDECSVSILDKKRLKMIREVLITILRKKKSYPGGV